MSDEVTEDAVRRALRDVIDPEIGLNIVDLGLLYGVEVSGGEVRIELTMTTPACPLSAHIQRDAELRVRSHCPGVTGVTVELVWSPPWGPHLMSDDAKAVLGWDRG